MKIALITNKGGRENNEDAIGRARKDGIYCFVLADGLGGQGSGEVASQLAVDTILECFNSHAEISKDVIYAYLEAAQNAIIDGRSQNTKNANMATTVTLLLTDGKKAVWAHCGDSRIYRLRKHLIQEVTDDHSVAFATFKAGEIKYSEIRTSPDQNKLIRSLSDGSTFKPDISNVTKVDKHTTFLMCSDGFWEYVDEDYMEKTSKRATGPKDWISRMLAENRAKAPDNADNFSAIAVFI